ncbi:hypothetical protein WA158_007918 [Blastocystis sp. Blastoise]
MFTYNKKKDEEGSLLQFAIVIRLLVWTLAIISSTIGGQFDDSLQEYIALHTEQQTFADKAIYTLIGTPFANWDALHFISIAEHGYQYEQQHAFFPGISFILRLLSNICFFGSVILLYRVTQSYFKDPQFSYRAAFFFAANPATIHTTAIYTESPFLFFSLLGLYILLQPNYSFHRKMLIASLCFFVTCLLRSNGALNAVFYLFTFALFNTPLPRSLSFLSPLLHHLYPLSSSTTPINKGIYTNTIDYQSLSQYSPSTFNSISSVNSVIKSNKKYNYKSINKSGNKSSNNVVNKSINKSSSKSSNKSSNNVVNKSPTKSPMKSPAKTRSFNHISVSDDSPITLRTPSHLRNTIPDQIISFNSESSYSENNSKIIDFPCSCMFLTAHMAVYGVISICPIIFYLYYCYSSYCTSDYHRPWCDAIIPNLYTYVQSYYWNVGPFAFYTHNHRFEICLGLPIIIYISPNDTLFNCIPIPLLPFISYAVVNFISGVIYVHVHVTTRYFMSTTILLPWFFAYISTYKHSFSSYCLIIYCIIYIFIGTCLFSMFLPWT